MTCNLFADCSATATHRVVKNWNGKEAVCCPEHIPGSRLQDADAPEHMKALAAKLNAYTVTPLADA